MESVETREHNAEANYRQIQELEQMVKTANKEISTWHTRAQTEPGFMAPPVVEEELNPALKKFLEQKAAEEAKEAEMAAKAAAQQEEQD